MDVKAVLHNLVTKGPLETYGIHYYNKRKAEEIKQSHGKKAVGSRKLSIKK
ncbi:MAG: hypothetical protein PUB39_06155 [Eubacteriales bacterium]|nr:hypothetical protein [Eubacteriales bacterium]